MGLPLPFCWGEMMHPAQPCTGLALHAGSGAPRGDKVMMTEISGWEELERVVVSGEWQMVPPLFGKGTYILNPSLKSCLTQRSLNAEVSSCLWDLGLGLSRVSSSPPSDTSGASLFLHQGRSQTSLLAP